MFGPADATDEKQKLEIGDAWRERILLGVKPIPQAVSKARVAAGRE